MIPLLLGVFGASLLGSLHCAGMCGGLVMAAVVDGPRGSRWQLHIGYHLSRLASYVALGLSAAAIGALIDMAGVLSGIASAAAWVAGALLVGMLLGHLLPSLTRRVPFPRIPDAVSRRWRALQVRALKLPRSTRAIAIGACTGLLPCGWLYAFVITAAGTGSPLAGAAVMTSFWLGTLPVLLAVGLGARSIFGRLVPRLPVWAPVLMLVLAFAALSGRFGLDPVALAQRTADAATEPGASLPDPNAVPACCAEGDLGGTH